MTRGCGGHEPEVATKPKELAMKAFARHIYKLQTNATMKMQRMGLGGGI
jgi:hypothetical protein